MSTTKGRWGGPRKGAGRRAAPPEQVRDQKVMIALTRGELKQLKRLAEKKELPPSTLAYQFVVRALKRK